MDTELWICPECLEKYEIEEEPGGGSQLGKCPMCKEYRNLLKTEPLKETETTKEGAEWLLQAQSSTHAENQTGI